MSSRQFGILTLFDRFYEPIRKDVLKQFLFSGNLMSLLCKETLLFHEYFFTVAAVNHVDYVFSIAA